MAINKVGSKGIEDGSVATVDLAPGTVTNAKLTNSSFTFDGTSISLGGSDSVNVSASWQSVITADGSTGTTAVAGNGYFIDTTSAAHTLTLPASATIGDFIAIKDYAGTFNTNNLTIARNGHNIQGVANDSLISTNRASLVLVYVDSTKGWLYWEEHNVADLQVNSFISATGGTITTSGDFKIHTFTGDGCFVVSTVGLGPSGGPSNVDYLVVAGGGSGGGGNGYYGGGGGAGGYRTTFPSPDCNAGTFPITATTYPITVGAGGADVSSGFNGPGNPGSNSVFSTITSSGGGAGSFGAGSPGGSGGGATSNSTLGGTGNTPPVSPPQGNPGGNAESGNQNCNAGGGGGGAAAAGTNVVRCGGPGTGGVSTAGPGGAGSPNAITGSSTTYAGGGGGGVTLYPPGPGGNSNLHIKGTGGTGGGGDGGDFGPAGGSPATAGSANTGGGGGGSSQNPDVGRAGGKGIVIIRYKFQ
jgi:hypothetical protein